MQIVSHCEVCDGRDLLPVLDLGAQPMCDDLVPIGSAERPKAYPLRLLACTRCLTVHQGVQVEKNLLFPRTYHYRASMTKDVLDGMRDLVDATERIAGNLSQKHVLDIGCNDGSLLAVFRERGAKTIGIEPTDAAVDAIPRVDLVMKRFFDSEAVDAYLAQRPQPDIITFTNVFAHIEDLNAVIASLTRLMKPDTLLVVENHYLGSVIARNQFDTFYHEHPRTYSYRSFEHIARKLERNIEHVEFPRRYNGNIRVVIGRGPAVQPNVDESGYLEGLERMQGLIEQARTSIRGRLVKLAAQHGSLPGKAFPGRASILVHSFGVTEELVDCTYERSSSPKIGHYVPGTRIEIRDEAEFFQDRRSAPVIVNFAWHIQAEIERYLRANGYLGEIVPLFE